MELMRTEPRQASGEARAHVPRFNGRTEAVAGVGEEEEIHVLVHGERLAPHEARLGERDDGDESGRGARRGRAVRFT
jgi:hypothetical protein